MASMRRRGFRLPQNEERELPISPVPQQAPDTADTDKHGITDKTKADLRHKFQIVMYAPYNSRRRNIHFKQKISQRTIMELNNLILEHLPVEPWIDELPRFTYAVASAATKKSPENEQSQKKRIRTLQLKEEILQWRRKGSQLQSLLDYIVTKTKFTKNML